MTRPAKFGALLLAAVTVTAALGAYLVVRYLDATGPPPSPVGRWSGDSISLVFDESGRLGPSVVPAEACPTHNPLAADGPLEVSSGTWAETSDADAGYLVRVQFTQPEECLLVLTSRGGKRERPTLWWSSGERSWILTRT
ncbi:hypothetical protein ACFVYP_07695 [Kitasatospora sp. NPDC058201]|uniref:hypothetical protein n=1 Tax=unclassified Kitasatospora TaxID=2633591 RepID=UPI0036521D24